MFESQDFIYVPASGIDASVNYYTKLLGGNLLWKIHVYRVWVACVKLAENSLLVLLAHHVSKKDTILIYHVSSLSKAKPELESGGCKEHIATRSQVIDTANGTIGYTNVGEGIPLLMIHGGGFEL